MPRSWLNAREWRLAIRGLYTVARVAVSSILPTSDLLERTGEAVCHISCASDSLCRVWARRHFWNSPGTVDISEARIEVTGGVILHGGGSDILRPVVEAYRAKIGPSA